MTVREREIRKKYTKIVNRGGAVTLVITIDQQEFQIKTSPQEVVWFRDMLAVALTRMVEKEANNA